MPVTRNQVETHLADFVAAARRWQLRGENDEHRGGLPCPVARICHRWTEFFALPVAIDAARRGTPDAAALATGLVSFLARVQREDGTFDAGFCGDLCQPCNAAFALRPLASSLIAWPADLDPAARNSLADVLARAGEACVHGGMNTPNHRWVAAAGLAHAARALDRDDLARAANEWTEARIDIDADGAYSEGSPKYALVCNDAFLDLEELQGRKDLGDLARRSLGYLRAMAHPDGELANVGSSRYDTEGSTDGYARAAVVFQRLGEPDLAARSLEKLWKSRSAPGLVVACATPPLGAAPKAKLYPSVVSALTAEHLLRRLELDDVSSGAESVARSRGVSTALRASGLATYRSGAFSAVAGAGSNLLELRAGGAVLEGARLLIHATGWNALHAVAQRFESDGLSLDLHSAPGADRIRLPQFHRDAPEKRRPGNAVEAGRAEWRVAFGPGPRALLEVAVTGPLGAHGLLELAARPDQALFDADGVRIAPPHAAPPAGRTVLAGSDAARLVIDHTGGSGHALQLAPYGYGVGDALWSPSFHPAAIRIGFTLPARLRVEFGVA